MSCSDCTPVVSNPTTPICPPPTPCPEQACTPSSYTCGDWTVTTNADCTTTRTRTSNNLANGTYQNATVTIQNGCLIAVSAGLRVLQSRPEPCTSASTTTPPDPTPVILSALPCNLTSLDAGGSLFTGLTINQTGQSIAVSGCGTPTSPLVFSYVGGAGLASVASTTLTVTTALGAVTINTQGTTVNAGGYVLSNGLVKTWTQPITAVSGVRGVKTSTTAGVTTAEYDSDTALVTSKNVIGASCGGTFVDPAAASPPASGTWIVGSAVVYGTRLFVNTPTPATMFDATGTALGNTPSVVTYGTHADALIALSNLYTFSGLAAC